MRRVFVFERGSESYRADELRGDSPAHELAHTTQQASFRNRTIAYGVTSDIAAEEDEALTAFLKLRIAEIHSLSHEPRPVCPRCGSDRIRSDGFRRRGPFRVPLFLCVVRARVFNRAANTPLHHCRVEKLDIFVSLLSQPISLLAAGERMGSPPSLIKKQVIAYRQWLLRIDAEGTWERRVRLGGRLTEVQAQSLAFDEVGERECADLTNRLTLEFDAINSMSKIPLPLCPDCGSRDVRSRAGKPNQFPFFQCRRRRQIFTRRRGTSFVGTRASTIPQIRDMIRFLSLPLSIIQVAEIIDADASNVMRWCAKFEKFADALEPNGLLSVHIRLGARPNRGTPCLFCGRTSAAINQDHRGWACSACGRAFEMRRTLIDRDGCVEIVADAT